MSWLLLAALALALVALAAAAWKLSHPRVVGQSGDLRLHAVAPGIFLFRAYFSNAVVFELPQRVVLVDALISPQSALLMRQAIEAQIGKPVTHIILTHYHGDHVGGTAAFPEAEIIASRDTARWMVERDDERRAYVDAFGLIAHSFPEPRQPTRLFDDQLTLALDGQTLEVLRLGATETEDACVVWWPQRRALATGDGVSTTGYPFLGAPVADEGLRDDGAWVGFLEAVEGLGPELLLPGHGRALVGAEAIRARLGLLRRVLTDVIEVTRAQMQGVTLDPEGVAGIVRRAEAGLGDYAAHPELAQNASTQRFAVYRAIHSMVPERRGRGWWDDLRPRLIQPAPPEEVRRARKGLRSAEELHGKIAAWCGQGQAMLARSVALSWLEDHPRDARTHAVLAMWMFKQLPGAGSIYDGSEFFKEARRHAGLALAVEDEPLAMVVMGILEVWSAVVLGQPMAPGVALLEGALAQGAGLGWKDRAAACFFLGKAAQYTLDEAGCDRWLRRALPWWLRFAYPLLRARLWAIP